MQVVRQHLAAVKTGDKAATVIFWLIVGSTGLFIGAFSIYLSFDGMRFGRSNHPAWSLVGIGVVFLAITFAGIWQCVRAVTNTEKRKDTT